MQQLSIKSAAKLMRKMRVSDGDVILVKQDTELSSDENMKTLMSSLKVIGFSATIVVVVDEFDHIKTLNEDGMNKFGWYRVEALKRFVGRGQQKSNG